MDHSNFKEWMGIALDEARLAEAEGEVPIGAVVISDGAIISRAHNEIEKRQKASAHAELLAIERASEKLGRWRLNDCTLVVTLEPCPMCIGASILSRIANVVFGCHDPRQGAVGSLFNLASHPGLPHSIEVYPEVRGDECKKLLENFFKEKVRAGKN